MEKNRYLTLSSVLLAFCILFLLSGLSKADNLSERVDDKIRKLSPAPETLKRQQTLLALTKVQVPNLNCKNYFEATRILKQKKLRIIKKGYALNKACQHKSDRVISQNPRAGTKLKSGSVISVMLTSIPLTAIITSTAPYKIVKGRSLSFQAKVNYRASKFKWKLNNNLGNQKGARFTVNTSKLSTGTHTITLEVYLKHLGLGSQREIVKRTFLVVAQAPVFLPAPIQTPASSPPTSFTAKETCNYFITNTTCFSNYTSTSRTSKDRSSIRSSGKGKGKG